jgi:hypothetical protein
MNSLENAGSRSVQVAGVIVLFYGTSKYHVLYEKSSPGIDRRDHNVSRFCQLLAETRERISTESRYLRFPNNHRLFSMELLHNVFRFPDIDMYFVVLLEVV